MYVFFLSFNEIFFPDVEEQIHTNTDILFPFILGEKKAERQAEMKTQFRFVIAQPLTVCSSKETEPTIDVVYSARF